MLERVYGVAMLTLPHPETRRPVLLPAAGRL